MNKNLLLRITNALYFCALFYYGAGSVGAEVLLSHVPYKPDSGSIAVHCGVLINGLSDTTFTNKTVVIESGRIVAVEDAAYVANKSALLDLSAYTCLPGLIDTHTHIGDADFDTVDLSIYYKRTREEQFAISKTNAMKTLLAGFTTARNVGAYIGWAGRDIRDAINKGNEIGPRIQTAGFYLTIPAGGGDLVIPGIPEESIPAHIRMGVARGADQFRLKAKEAVAGGADVLKVIASGAVLAFGGVPGAPEMTREEIAAVVEVAHAAGIKVTAHAHGAQSIKDAIRAGVDSIEHASLADDEAIELALINNVAFSMDVYNGDYIATVGRSEGWPEEFIRKNDETTEAQRLVFTKAYKAGVPILYGTDAAVYPFGDNAKQFVIMVHRGMTPMDAIKSATSVAALYIGWKNVGAIEPGRYADLIAVKGNPLNDTAVLQHVEVVIKGGHLFKLPEEMQK
ncbi:MAG: imidazolonepropionase-like amidohydrolase [Gammaproteobacteria bacterium]|jgi:imidazolonepropionase-like amidohydrolase